MQTRADVVIIGGGIIGMAVAFYMAKSRMGQIALLEKDAIPGTGATAKAAGGIRAQFMTRVNIEMSMLSEREFIRFAEETGHEALFDQVGYMFLLEDDRDIESFTRAHELQRSLGLNVEMLTPSQIGEIAPHVSLDGIKKATFCRSDGLGDPHEFLSGYEHAARRTGVCIEYDAEVTGIEQSGGRVSGVATNKGNITTPLVINCAGPHAKLIARMAGAKLDVEPIRRQIVTTGELDFMHPDFPMVVDVKSGLYCHKESNGLLMGWADKSVAPSFDISIDPDYTDTILEKALERIPRLETAEIANQWAGLYETTPDHHAVIGWEPTVDGLFHVTGFSGHGFMHAPAAGMVTAQMIRGEKTSVDISALSPTRFGAGELVHETNVI